MRRGPAVTPARPALPTPGSTLLAPGAVVVVTGAARGIGRATALLLAAHGARLALCDRLGEELAWVADDLRAAGVDVHTEELDVRDGEAVHSFVTAAVERFGRIDVLVNNAGGSFASPFLDVSAKGEAAIVAENFTQATNLVRTCVGAMGPGSSIVNITSSEAFQAAPGFAIYAAMKAALESLTKSLALELAGAGVRVNAVAPDALASHGESVARADLLASPGRFSPTHRPPLGSFGEPDDAAAAVLFLASPMARFVTGATIHVDGGIHAAGGWRLDP